MYSPSSLTLEDDRRLMTLVMMSAADMANGIASRGHMYAITHASSSLSAPNALREQVGGMLQVRHYFHWRLYDLSITEILYYTGESDEDGG